MWVTKGGGEGGEKGERGGKKGKKGEKGGGVPSMTALSVPQHKPMCTIAFGGSTWTDDIALGLRRKKSFSLARERVEGRKRSSEQPALVHQFLTPWALA